LSHTYNTPRDAAAAYSIVDDDPDLLTLLSAHYSVRGYEVAVAETCEAALRLAAERRPDAVLLDFCLPKMDGARFIEILRADELTKKTPVIVMSAASASWVAARLPRGPPHRHCSRSRSSSRRSIRCSRTSWPSRPGLNRRLPPLRGI
jgi:response regulator RpfG family c-di-GMP phosphodiesterase